MGASLVVDPEREVFPYPFVRLVNAYVSFDGKLTASDHDAILRPVLDASYNVVLSSPSAEKSEGELFTAVHEADLVTVLQDGLHVLTVQYERWERFRGVVEALLGHVAKGRGIEYSSVRFLDEIRPPSSTDLFEWTKYVNLPVVTEDVVLDHVEGHYGGLVLHLDDNKHVNIEWAPTYEPAISDDHPLRVHYEEPKDSVLAVEWTGWCRFEDHASEDAALRELDSLHEVIKESFLRVLTPASMNLLRGEA
ncbi:TIGR04255 family protein [Candidatus Poriferisodalis sp.]|uniref:TIGR04255 family protein n=1 Tax=Candidatus Poriferisodalis sp. TaxID=3101277 RepID=UPI003B52EFA3